ncbi:SpoIIE family protein phosphatase [Streptomyces sp. NPDC012474]|uniref:SpoIIE family protein phosphatase n=1 Tax=Streptomyces sp. NPDC012474 TaxID=3364836 RepID=UPI0036EBDBE4
MEQQRTPGVEQPDRPDDVFEEARTARATVDEHGLVTGWSEGARRLLGYPPEEIIGKPAACLLGDVTAGTLSAIRALPRWNGRVRLRHRDGHPVDAGLLAHHRVGARNPDWLVVSPLADTAAIPGDELLAERSFQQTTRCGMAVYDTRLRLRLANHYAEDVFGLTEADMRGLRHSEILGPSGDKVERAMVQVLKTGEPQYLESYMPAPDDTRQPAWLVFAYPLRDADGVVRGVCVCGHDMTEQFWASKRLQLLNEAGTRIGTTLDVMRTAQELAEVTVPEFADFTAVDLLCDPDAVRQGASTAAMGSVRLRCVAHQSVLPGTPEAVVAPGEEHSYAPASPMGQCLATGRAVLRAEYDSQAADFSMGDPRRDAAIRGFGIHSLIAVPLRARGITLGVAVFARHEWPEAFGAEDLLLAEELADRAAVYVDNARRYTRERETAVALQKALLPQRLPRQVAVEAAWRYLPTGTLTGVGGDWFDVIPLSGARVALVVGDVVGHGIQAAAAMGRLRTAVRTLADVDLPPDELLTHLDDLVIRLAADTDDAAPPDHAAETAEGLGATCLYTVYDPVSRVCTLARAGHPGPALISPEGTVDFLDLPAGPPLGLGGLPFENAEVTLPEGSVLALYTDGLITMRDQDLDQSLARLRQVLSRPTACLDDLCDAVLATLPLEHRTDDIALLLARTHALDARQVATWDLPADPAIVAQARRLVRTQLSTWNLMDACFVTELVVSELVTNAIRYADPPIQLRLIHDRHLICEVSDASSTAPHLRRARAYDEGGRGLLLVAQLTRGWGTRHTRAGKTIWAEQALGSEAG